MESTNVESQEPLLRDHTETSSQLKQEAAPQSPSHTGSKTPYRDSIFTFLILTAILTTFTFGIITSTHADTLNLDTKLRLSNYNPTTAKCEITQQQTPKASDSDPNSEFAFVKLVALTSLFAIARIIPFTLLLVSLLRRYKHILVDLSAPVMFLLFLGLGILCISQCRLFLKEQREPVPGSWIFDLVHASCTLAVFGYLFGGNRKGSAVENKFEALRMATGFWKEHFVLLVVNPVLLLSAMVLVNGPIFTFMWYAYNVGEIVPDFGVVNDPIKGCGLSTGIGCCREERPGWVDAYITFAGITAFWVLMVSIVLQHSVVSGTVSLWYFSPKGTSAIGNMKRSLRNAYGPSFGTSCNLGSIVTTVVVVRVRILKEVLSDTLKVLESNGQGMMLSIMQGCFSCVSLFPTRYPQSSAIFLGIWESSKKSHRNLLQRTSSIPLAISDSHDLALSTLLGMILICVSLQTLIVYGVLEYFSNEFVWIYCLPITVVGLETGFLLALSSVIKSVSFCYALEKEVGEISRPEVCRAFMSTEPLLPETDGAQVAAP